MLYTIENDILKVTVSDVGAELTSIQTKKDGHEYLWQGDKKYWAGQAYNLFPVIGRMYKGQYDYRGKTYDMPLHGFIRKNLLTAEKEGEKRVSFTYTENEETLRLYPFKFLYKVTFTLSGNQLSVATSVKNTDGKTIHFGVGGHPGFFVPMEEGLAFEDYYIRFENAKNTQQCIMSEEVLFTGMLPAYELKNGNLPLTHDLFPMDALVLKNTGGKAVIQSDKGTRRVTMYYPDMKYMGVWHKPQTDAPYICLEPWSMLPASTEGRDDFETRPDITHLPVGETYENIWTLEIE